MRGAGGLVPLITGLLMGCRIPGGWEQASLDSGAPDSVPTVTIREAGGHGLTLVRTELEGGREAWMVLDSGSSVVVLDGGLARELGLLRRGQVGVGGCGLRAGIRSGGRFRLGPLVVRDPLYLSLDLEPFLADVSSPVPVEGIVGEPVLRHGVVWIDYGPEVDRVWIRDPAGYRLPEGGWISGGFRHGRPVAPFRLSVAPERDAWVVVDTGKSGTVSLSNHFAAQVGLPGETPTQRVPNQRICGVSHEHALELDWVELAGRRIEPAPIRLRIPGTDAARNEGPEDGVVGRAFLERFSVVLDFSRRRVALIENNEHLQTRDR